MALATSWLVAFSRVRSWPRLRQTALVYCAMVLPALAVAFVIATPLVDFVYSGRYVAGALVFPFFCVAQAISGLECVYTTFLKAAGALRRGYLPQMVGAVVSVSLGALFIPSPEEMG